MYSYTRIFNSGFSLLELLLCLSILAMALVFSNSFFSDALTTQKALSQAQNLVHRLNYARTFAISTSRSVTVCFQLDDAGCESEMAQHKKIIAFLDENQNQIRDINEEIVFSDSLSDDFFELKWEPFRGHNQYKYLPTGSTNENNGSLFLYTGNYVKNEFTVQITIAKSGRARIYETRF
ncbi:MAG: GspH/FimT family pseudopilin [Pseudomonadota bacterium]